MTAPDNEHLGDDDPRLAVNDPVALAKAARIVRVALARKPPSEGDDGGDR